MFYPYSRLRPYVDLLSFSLTLSLSFSLSLSLSLVSYLSVCVCVCAYVCACLRACLTLLYFTVCMFRLSMPPAVPPPGPISEYAVDGSGMLEILQSLELLHTVDDR